MLKQVITFLLFILIFFQAEPLNGQRKFEKESRLDIQEVPTTAIEFIDSLYVPGKIKWYLEEGFNTTSIEAKFKLNKQAYSVEFDTLGQLEDIEIKMKWKRLDHTLRDTISSELSKECKKHKIKKVQIQYSGDPQVLLSKLKSGHSDQSYLTRYELVVKCCNKKDVVLKEFLFDDAGQKLSSSEIVSKISSNLEY